MTTVLRGGLSDRVPFHPSIFFDHAFVACGKRFEDMLINPMLGNPYMLEAAQRYQTDTVRFMIVPDDEWCRTKVVKEEADGVFQYDRKTGKREGAFDVQGGGKLQLFEPPPPMQTMRDVKNIPVMPAIEYEQRGHLRGMRECIEQAHALGFFVVGFCTSQTINFMVEKLGGPEPALLSFLDDPDLARTLIDKAVEISIEKGKALVAAGVDLIYIGDSYASASVISPEIYRSFCAPAYRQTASAMHALGVFVYKHCCGYYDPLLQHLPSTGIDAMDGIDPTTGMSVAHTKKVIGDKLTLMGGLSCMTLLQGTPEEAYEDARRCIEAGKPGGRYVLGTACATPRNTPPRNFDAVRKALDDHGWY